MGGMAAFIPIKNNKAANDAAMAKVRLIILARCLITFSNVTHICSLD